MIRLLNLSFYLTLLVVGVSSQDYRFPVKDENKGEPYGVDW
jgi:hypothetical protein